MTGYIILALILAVVITPGLVTSYRRSQRQRSARRMVEAQRQRELEARRYQESLAEVTGWDPADVAARLGQALQAGKTEATYEDLTPEQLARVKFEFEKALGTWPSNAVQLDPGGVEYDLTYHSGTRLAEQARKTRRTTARSVSVDGSVENSIIVTGDGSKIGMRWPEDFHSIENSRERSRRQVDEAIENARRHLR